MSSDECSVNSLSPPSTSSTARFPLTYLRVLDKLPLPERYLVLNAAGQDPTEEYSELSIPTQTHDTTNQHKQINNQNDDDTDLDASDIEDEVSELNETLDGLGTGSITGSITGSASGTASGSGSMTSIRHNSDIKYSKEESDSEDDIQYKEPCTRYRTYNNKHQDKVIEKKQEYSNRVVSYKTHGQPQHQHGQGRRSKGYSRNVLSNPSWKKGKSFSA